MSIQRLSVLVLISKQQCALACTARVAAPLHHSRHGAQAASCFCRQASCRCAARHPHSASCHSACRQSSCSGRADQRKTAGCLSQHRQPARQPARLWRSFAGRWSRRCAATRTGKATTPSWSSRTSSTGSSPRHGARRAPRARSCSRCSRHGCRAPSRCGRDPEARSTATSPVLVDSSTLD